ncbi:cadmium-translocating P-type ATPase [Listeria monocytogenes]|uniref:cadmium-translocating P-type ATPase CadA n=1 Tax=Listeria monocytogenes TaxID=1639 RepID=UPI000E6BB296|nr:cadmium-translocating P-type ATPase CadA [Listeria monocytogenes]EDN8197843.1 cadmium-translocating P-type ATPase [Listeria monocytogenes]RJA59634.1 cadmium-translocating P-type ATPase [Listeria monocytogenes]RJA72132.1 cadmium-translocating P-type ATPase [Listeria monocytogenes]RJC01260.1 cadmium-translocating P-type ATPase [Listeria monocytogenes]HAA2984762.1 heavy metal translocating P-type ATPase [Listeria monocytogenes]
MMKKEYVLEGLTCANCAGKIERDVKKINGVENVSLSLMNTTLTLDKKNDSGLDSKIKEIVHKYEPEVGVFLKKEYEKESKRSLSLKDNKIFLQLVVGTFIFVIAIVVNMQEDINDWLKFGIFLVSYAILGGNVLLRAIRNIFKGQVFDENFLMSIATIGAFIIGETAEAVAVMLFYQIGELFQDIAVKRSKKSITDLMDIRPDYANLKIGNDIKKVKPETIKIGDIIVVKPGEKVSLDGVVIDGESMLDTKALTGESVPRKTKAGDNVLSGCINQSGVLTIEVTKTFGESTVAKIIDLVENASSKKAPTENFITTFSRYYTPVVVIVATLLAVIPPLFFGGEWSDWLNRGLIFLVISCPCALVVSIPLGFFGGIGGASKHGILVKGSNYLEALNNVDTIVFDKTGTLTEGVFEVTSINTSNGFTEEQLVEYGAKAETLSNHPIALSIKSAYGKEVELSELDSYREIAGHGISVKIDQKPVLAGNEKLMKKHNVGYTTNSETGTVVYIAVDNVFAGSIVISDKIKKDSFEAIQSLKSKGVQKTIMLTGDNKVIAQNIAKELSLDEVYSELLPTDKVNILEKLEAKELGKRKLAFVGDGINDAPVLARADIGIAMGGLGSDAAIEAADIVLMTDEPSKIAKAIDIAGFTKKIVWQNIIFALAIKAVFLTLGAFGIATMWEAVFADVGVSILAILNATRVIRYK